MLYDFARPRSDLFIPRNHTPRPLYRRPIHALPLLSSLADTTPGYATPMPEQPLSSSPAWDPSSRTPVGEIEADPDVEQPQSNLAGPSHGPVPQDQGVYQNVLLDPRLLNARLKVVVKGWEREVVATIEYVDGLLSFRRKYYKTFIPLNPEDVAPEIPNPTRSNGLIVVIKGAHCGKFVRRIHHRFEDDGAITILMLAVVKRVIGSPESLTGEQLELDASHLCLCDESKEDRKLGDSLMDDLRRVGRKIRAK